MTIKNKRYKFTIHPAGYGQTPEEAWEDARMQIDAEGLSPTLPPFEVVEEEPWTDYIVDCGDISDLSPCV